MKRLFVLCLLMVLLVSGVSYAATKASAVTQVGETVAVCDGSTGDSQEVTTAGSAATTNWSVAKASQYSIGSVRTGASRLQSITVTSQTAGDWAAIYDAASATGTPVFDVAISANTSTMTVDCKGASLSTGIYINTYDGDVFTTVVYDY
jgi:uncharacterized iron-regulated membrane protein